MRALALVLWLAVSLRAAPVELRSTPAPLSAGPVSETVLRAQAERMASVYAAQLPEARTQMEELFASLGEVTARAKQPDSIAAKLRGRGADGSDPVLAERIVRDGVGARLTLALSSPAGIEALVERLASAFENGRLNAVTLSNFRAEEDGRPYFSETHMERLAEAAKKGGLELRIRPPEKSLIPAGYTAVHMNVIFVNGARGEVQIRGRLVHELAEREHASYDARRGKRTREAGDRPLEGLDEVQNSAHLAYTSSLYGHARRLESTPSSDPLPPPLPDSLSQRPDLSLSPR